MLQLFEQFGNAEYSVSSCKLTGVWTRPFNKARDGLNSCFITTIVFASTIFWAIVSIIQIWNLIYNNHFGLERIKYSFGSSFKLRSVGIYQLVKLNSVLLQIILLSLLTSLNFKSFNNLQSVSITVKALLTTSVFFPFHIIESTRSIIPSGGLLFYWFFDIILNILVLLNDSISNTKVYIPKSSRELATLALVLEMAITLNSVIIFAFEVGLYRPTVELVEYFDLNGWDKNRLRNVFTSCLFLWIQPVMYKIYKDNEIEHEMIPPQDIEQTVDVSYTVFEKHWNAAVASATRRRDQKLSKIFNPTDEDRNVKVSLLYVIFRTYWFKIAEGFFWDFAEMSASFIRPFILQAFIKFFNSFKSDDEQTSNNLMVGYTIAISMFLVSIVRLLCKSRYMASFKCIEYSLVAALNSKIYDKVINLSPEERANKSTGDIVNNVAVDINLVTGCSMDVEDMLVTPLRLLFSLSAIYIILGNSTFVGVIVAGLSIPLSMPLMRRLFQLFELNLKYKDARTRLTSDILTSIKSVKLYSWEKPLIKRLSEIRNDKELVTNITCGIYSSILEYSWTIIPYAISASCLVAFATFDKRVLTPAIVFPAISLFNTLAAPIQMFPETLTKVFESKVSAQRLSDVYFMNELSEVVERTQMPLKKNDVSVEVKNANFLWKPQKKFEVRHEEGTIEADSNDYSLRDINLTATKGSLTCIVGRVGSGKTTLLRALLGEVPLLKGKDTKVWVNGPVVYCPQSPWILNGSVKENILFGHKYNNAWYERVVQACELLSDYKTLPDGDQTVVGEKGISLSGGQKARIALARAVYAKADVYFLDDVLSAVDAHVGKNLIKKVLGPNGLLATKTIILATNSINVLKYAKIIYFLQSMRIVEEGSFKEIIDGDSESSRLLKEFSSHHEEKEQRDPTPTTIDLSSNAEGVEKTKNIFEFLEEEELAMKKTESCDTLGATSVVSLGHEYDEDIGIKKEKRTGMSEEIKSKGKVQLHIYIEFLKAANLRYVFIFIVCMALQIGGMIGSNYLLNVWSEKNLNEGKNVYPVFYLSFYVLVCLASSALVLIGTIIIWCYCVISSSKHFHDKMIWSVVSAPMSFFDTTPVGRILNRFSEDINVIDSHLIWVFIDFIMGVFRVAGMLGVVIAGLPGMFFIIVGFSLLYNYSRTLYTPAARELRRLSSARRSPIFSHLQESINGVEVIRAFNQIGRFKHKNKVNLDIRLKVMNASLNNGRWLSIRLEAISSMIVFATAILSLVSLNTSQRISNGMVGFVMVQALSITITLTYITQMWANIETSSVSVERVVEYSHLEPEAEFEIPETKPEESWPQNGAIELKNYSTRYRENLDPVLKNLTLSIGSKEKIGVVGRTGAGKSSLTLAIFRIIEATSGNIEIDGEDTSKLGLYDLRRHLNIIPQDSHTIEGTVRQNLDPFDRYTDDELWKVLELAHLKDHVKQMKTEKKPLEGERSRKKDKKTNDSSDTEVKEYDVGFEARIQSDGSNLSSGQKQLLSLARALLNKSPILILDEATAAVDVQTDKFVQQAIREYFKEMTILTIAHRIDTILDSDRILVLDKGEISQFDSPTNLIRNHEGIFYSLCKEGGYLSKLENITR